MRHVTTLDCLITGQDQEAFCAWQGERGPKLIAQAYERAQRAVTVWGVTGLTPLRGGALSLIGVGEREGEKVVVKVPLLRAGVGERIALTRLPGGPRLLDWQEDTLLMEYLPARPVSGQDVGALAQAVLTIHGDGVREHHDLPSWEQMHETLVGQWVRLLPSHNPEAAHLLETFEQELPVALLGERTACHGDLWAKNVLRGAGGQVHIVDPMGVGAPAGWDVALACLSAALDGGDAKVVLEAGKEAGVERVRSWLAVAAPVVLCNRRAQNQDTLGRMLEEIGELRELAGQA